MSKGGTSAPSPINTGQLTQQTAQASAEAAAQQAQLSNIDTSSPLGTSNFTPVGTGPGGIGPDHYTLNQTLGSQTQPVYNTQTQLAQLLAQQGVNAAGLIGSPVQAGANIVDNAYNGLSGALPTGGLNLNGLTALPSSSSDFSNEVTNAGNAAYNTQEAYLKPQQAEQSSDFAQQMADQGIAPGSDAYSRGYGDLSRAQTFANQQAQNAAVTAGDQEQSQLYGENLSSRQEGVNEALQQYQAPINALGSLASTGEGILSGAASQLPSLDNLANFTWASGIPTFGGGQSTLSSPNVPQAAQAATQSALNSFNAGNTLNSQLGNTIGSLGGSNLLFGSGGASQALGLGSSGIFGALTGGGGAAGIDPSIFAGGSTGALDLAALFA